MEWIERCEIADLDNFEEEFIESIKEQLQRKGSLTPRQVQVLEEIYTRKT